MADHELAAPAEPAPAEVKPAETARKKGVSTGTAKKSPTGGGAQIEYQPFLLGGKPKELHVKTPHHEYMHCADNKDVRIPIETVRKIANYASKRLSYLKGLKNLENTTRTEVETLLLAYGDKWVQWGNFLEGRTKLEELPEIEQADLDLAYYLLEDEIFQRGTLLGYETILHGPGIVMSGLQGSRIIPYRSQWEVEVRQHSPAARGDFTYYQRFIYADTQDPVKISDDLRNLERTRIELIQGLTGKNPHDPVWRRANWGLCLDSLGRQDRSEITLHTQILQHLNGNKDFRAVLERYKRTHPHIKTITDLLINVSNAEDRRIVVEAYIEAQNVAVASRLKERGHDFLGKHILAGRERAWAELGLVEQAGKNKEILEEDKNLSNKHKGILTQLQTDLGKVKEFLSGTTGEAITSPSGGLAGKILELQTTINTYREYLARPENDLTQLQTALSEAEARYNEYLSFTFPAIDINNATPIILTLTNIPPNIQTLIAEINELKRLYPEVNTGTAPYIFTNPAEKLRTLREMSARATSLGNSLQIAIEEQREKEKATADSLRGKIDGIRNGGKPLSDAVENAYKFLETELPTAISSIDDMRQRLDELVTNQPTQLSTEHLTELRQQLAYLDNLTAYLTDNVATALRRNFATGETTQAYVQRIAYYFDTNAFQTQLRNLTSHIRAYKEKDILEAKRENELVPGIKLVSYLASKKDGQDPLIIKAYKKSLAEAQAGELKILQNLYDNHDLNALRDLICNHPEIIEDEETRNPDLWRRVFSDVFFLQSAVEFYSQKGALDIPPEGIAVNLENLDDEFRKRLIERMASSHIELGEFLTFLLEKRLRDAAYNLSVAAEVYEARPPAADGGNIDYDDTPRLGAAATIFQVEANDHFMQRVRAGRHMHFREMTNEIGIDNIGFVRYIRPNLDWENIEGDLARLETHESDAVVLDMGGRRREFSVYLTLGHGIPSSIFGRSGFRLHIRASPTLDGLNIGQFRGRFNNRWVDFGWHRYRDHESFRDALRSLVPNAIGDQFRDEMDNYVLRTLGNWFISTSRDIKRQYRYFPDVEITDTDGISDQLYNAGYRRLSLDRASGELVFTRENGKRVSAYTALRRDADNPMNTVGVDQLFRFVGRQVFDILGRR